MKKFYISTPIYYSSGVPHIGHAYSTIMADVLARYKKFIGYDIFFVTGMDEHGQKIEDKAKENNLSPQVFVDEIAKKFIKLWDLIDINESYFIRTSNPEHEKYIQNAMTTLYKKDFLYKGTWETLYCVSCEENIRESDIVIRNEKKTCCHGHPLTKKSEETYFLRVTAFKEWIIQYYKDNSNFIFPSSRVKELVNNFLNEEFDDLSVTRTGVSWGVTFLEDPKHTVYVWIDALLNYVSSLEINHQMESFWNEDSQKVHILSKEITRFHCIYWPILLKMLDLPMPTKILSHGWIITKDKKTDEIIKMSKSLNNVIDPLLIIEQYNSDVLRYFLMKGINVSFDTVFDEEVLFATYNSDLANNFGNIISRTIGMVKKYHNGIIPNYVAPTLKINIDFEVDIKNLFNYLIKKIDELNVNKIVDGLIAIANHINAFIENSKPWEYFKNDNQIAITEFLSIIYNAVKVYVISSQPILVKKAQAAIEQLNFKSESLVFENLFKYELNDQIKVNDSDPIFLRKSKD